MSDGIIFRPRNLAPPILDIAWEVVPDDEAERINEMRRWTEPYRALGLKNLTELKRLIDEEERPQ